jgi:hypothetical protein
MTGDSHPDLADVAWESELIGGPAAKAIADEIVIGTRGFGRVRVGSRPHSRAGSHG